MKKLLAAMFVALQAFGEEQVFRGLTSADGQKIYVEVITINENDAIVVRVKDGKKFKMPYSLLSQKDKDWFKEKLSLPRSNQAFTVPVVGVEMLWVRPGTFEMGSYEYTRHTVTLTDGYWLGKHEVTQSQWQKVMGSNPSRFKGVDRPVESVSWTEVTSFCDKLTASERMAGRLSAGMAYQLPTEAQWEYACRAGTKTAFSFGNSLTARQANIWPLLQSTSTWASSTGVGKYLANGWGFHDMHGNVSEWCADWYGDYPAGAARDPVGPAVGSNRVGRGGSWLNTAYGARSANRGGNGPASSYYNLGFRLSLRPASK
jgi:formylglycine-generating enzyme required for sulfatase activity